MLFADDGHGSVCLPCAAAIYGGTVRLRDSETPVLRESSQNMPYVLVAHDNRKLHHKGTRGEGGKLAACLRESSLPMRLVQPLVDATLRVLVT